MMTFNMLQTFIDCWLGSYWRLQLPCHNRLHDLEHCLQTWVLDPFNFQRHRLRLQPRMLYWLDQNCTSTLWFWPVTWLSSRRVQAWILRFLWLGPIRVFCTNSQISTALRALNTTPNLANTFEWSLLHRLCHRCSP